MPLAYFVTLVVSVILNPSVDVLQQEPSELGRVNAAYPFVYNFGMVATGLTGLLAAGGLVTSQSSGRGSPWSVGAGVTILLASTGVMMAGIFPLPDPRHYGFGVTTAAVLTPVFGAVSMWRSANRLAAALLIVTFTLIVGLVAARASLLAPGALMFGSIACLCWNVRRQTGVQQL